ncbi:MAG: hypothetical protein HY770_02395 [Chitinivibrionia bacterium]|nr:hypothetical protein [Chitinivibrionia bacterium]
MKTWIVIAVLLLCLVPALSCDKESPTALDRPPVIRTYKPLTHSLIALLGDTLTFSVKAFDPENRALTYRFLIGDSIACASQDWVYVVDETGPANIGCVVSDGIQTERIAWQINRVAPVNIPPVITNYEPDNLSPSYIVGSSIGFSMTAYDPEGLPVSYEYTVGDVVVSRARQFNYETTSVGELLVRGRAHDGERYSPSVIWTVQVTAIPDSVLPAPVPILLFRTGEDAGEVHIEWVAVGDDSMDGLPAQYQIRTSSTPIRDEGTWARANDRPGEPLPLPAGEVMRATIRGLIPTNYVYIAVRAKDEFGNLSPLGDSPGATVKGMETYGVVKNALTGGPVPGISVNIASSTEMTDVDGMFAFTELPQFSGYLNVRDETAAGEYGEYFDLRRYHVVINKSFITLWVIPNAVLETDPSGAYYPSFLSFFMRMTDTEGNPFGNTIRRWALPINIYVPKGVYGGIDYEAEVLAALGDWESLSGLNLFERVASPPDVGVTVVYEDTDFNGGYEMHEISQWTMDMYPMKSVVHLIKKYTPETIAFNRRVMRHEFGHALLLKHSSNPNHLMIGGISAQVELPTIDELHVLSALYTLPRGENIDNHLFD